jgi:hypothetical protein
MKLSLPTMSMSKLSPSSRVTIEYALAIAMVVYLFFYGGSSGTIPYWLANILSSTLAIATIVIGLVAVIRYSSNAILPMVYAIFAWVIVSKSLNMTKHVGLAKLEFTPTTESVARKEKITPPTHKQDTSLEEQVVARIAPNQGTHYVESAYKPFFHDVHNASYV